MSSTGGHTLLSGVSYVLSEVSTKLYTLPGSNDAGSLSDMLDGVCQESTFDPCPLLKCHIYKRKAAWSATDPGHLSTNERTLLAFAVQRPHALSLWLVSSLIQKEGRRAICRPSTFDHPGLFLAEVTFRTVLTPLVWDEGVRTLLAGTCGNVCCAVSVLISSITPMYRMLIDFQLRSGGCP